MQFDQLLHFVAAPRELARDHETPARQRLRRQAARLGFELQPRGAQAADDPQVVLLGEVFDDGVGDASAHLVGLDQLLARGPHHGVQRAEMLGEVFGRGLAHEADSQPEQHALEGNRLRAFHRADDVVGRLLAQPGQGGQLFGPQVVEVRHVAHESVFVEQFDGLLAQPLDVEGLAADEVDDAPDDLGPASALVGAVVLGLAFVAHQRRPALGAYGDVLERTAVGRALREVHADDLRDDLAALLDVDRVARADVQLGHLLGVVQRRAPHGGSGQQHRFEVGDGRDSPGASYLERHAVEPRGGPFGLELVGHGPLGGLGCESQLAPDGEVVDLDHHAVRREGQAAPCGVPVFDKCVDLGDAAADARRVRDLEPPLAGLFEALPMAREGQLVARQLVECAVQSAPGHHGRRLLLERPGGGVAGVGEELLAVGLALGVEAVERGVGHQDLAADFEEVGPVRAPQAQGHRAHGADIGRHVVALDAVAAGHGAHEPSVLVGERDGRAVEFQFADVVRGPGFAFDAADELVQFVQRVGVAQRQHRVAVLHGPELGRQVASHAHRRRVGVGVFGVCALQILKFAHHRVELEIRNLRGVFDVIFEVMQFELPAQLLDPFAYHNP